MLLQFQYNNRPCITQPEVIKFKYTLEYNLKQLLFIANNDMIFTTE